MDEPTFIVSWKDRSVLKRRPERGMRCTTVTLSTIAKHGGRLDPEYYLNLERLEKTPDLSGLMEGVEGAFSTFEELRPMVARLKYVVKNKYEKEAKALRKELVKRLKEIAAKMEEIDG